MLSVVVTEHKPFVSTSVIVRGPGVTKLSTIQFDVSVETVKNPPAGETDQRYVLPGTAGVQYMMSSPVHGSTGPEIAGTGLYVTDTFRVDVAWQSPVAFFSTTVST
jgi:hypothetical protein